MFTGIIEHQGTIESLTISRGGGRVTIHAPTIAPSLAVSDRKSTRLNSSHRL